MSKVVMIGTHYNTMGGISSVVGVYRAAGLFDRCQISYIATHRDGTAVQKLSILVQAWLRFMIGLLCFRWQIVHVHVSSRASFWRKTLFVLPAFAFGRAVVLHLHGAEFKIFFGEECSDWQKAVVRHVFRRSRCVIVLSPSWKAWVETHCPNRDVRVVFNPVLFREHATKPDNSYAARRILFLGRLGKRKGAYDLVDALAALKRDGLDATVLMGGDGEVDQVREYANRAGVGEQVQFLGWVRGADKQRHLDDATVYALPSYNEGLPMGVLEAMEAGLPVVSTPVGGIPDAVTPSVEGALVQPGDVPALAEALKQLLSQPELARQQGLAARAKIRGHFSHLAVEPQLKSVYEDVLRGRS